MDPLLLKYYNRELQHLREMGGEFASEFPKIAGRLGMEGLDCADPYVERLLEGFSFLAARVQLRIDAEYPRFTQHLLEMVYPHYLAPIPSMTVVQFKPDLTEGSLAEGFSIPRHTVLRSVLGKGEQTSCEYRTSHDVTLWPLEIVEAEYVVNLSAIGNADFVKQKDLKAAIRIRLRTTAGLTFDKLPMESLSIFLRGRDELPMRIYEQIIANGVSIVVRPAKRESAWHEVIDKSHIRQQGFEEDQALLPNGPRSFSGYRLLQEYFAFPERFMFFELDGLGPAIRRCKDAELDIIVMLNRSDPTLENTVTAADFALYCAPAINLFPKRADRIHLADNVAEHHVVPDRTRPMDFELYNISSVVGHGTSAEDEQEFLPFYAANDMTRHHEHRAFFSVQRERRALSAKQRKFGPRSSYIGSETSISLVDAREAPYSSNLRQLAVKTLCTNRDLPLQMSVGKGKTDFTMEVGAPVNEVRCIRGPTRPRPSLAHADGEVVWRVVNHLSLNYLSLMDDEDKQGAAVLRDMLSLYGDMSEAAIRKQIDGVRSVVARQVTRRIPIPGPIAFGRGLEVTLTLDESAFEGTGVFLLGSVLEQFFARYVSINSFSETVVSTLDRGEVIRWPARTGQRQIL